MRVVVVSPHPVTPADSGDRVRTSQLLQGLLNAGEDARLVTWDWGLDREREPWPSIVLSGRPNGTLRWALWRGSLAVRRQWQPFALYRSRSIDDRLRLALEELQPDVVDFQHSYTWLPTRWPDVLTMHNVEANLATRRRSAVRRMEQVALAGARKIVTFSRDDASAAREIAPRCEPEVVPLGYEPRARPKEEHREAVTTICYIGSFDYEPNVEAVRALVAIWPDLQSLGVRHLVIAGRRAADSIAGLVSGLAGVEVQSDVADTGAVLTASDLLVVPLISGGGVRVKIIEAFALGVPVVSTALGIEGLDAVDGVHAAVVPTHHEVVDGVRRLLPRTARAAMASAARMLWEERFSARTMTDRMRVVYGTTAALGR